MSDSTETYGAQYLARAGAQLDRVYDVMQAILRLPELAALNAKDSLVSLSGSSLVMKLMERALEGFGYERGSVGLPANEPHWAEVERNFTKRCLALADAEQKWAEAEHYTTRHNYRHNYYVARAAGSQAQSDLTK